MEKDENDNSKMENPKHQILIDKLDANRPTLCTFVPSCYTFYGSLEWVGRLLAPVIQV